MFRATWDVIKQDSFLLNLDNDDITQFINHMDSLDGNYTKNDVDLLTSQCASLLYNAADERGIFISLSCRPDGHLIMNEQIENVNTTIHRATWDVSKQDSFLLNLDKYSKK